MSPYFDFIIFIPLFLIIKSSLSYLYNIVVFLHVHQLTVNTHQSLPKLVFVSIPSPCMKMEETWHVSILSPCIKMEETWHVFLFHHSLKKLFVQLFQRTLSILNKKLCQNFDGKLYVNQALDRVPIFWTLPICCKYSQMLIC